MTWGPIAMHLRELREPSLCTGQAELPRAGRKNLLGAIQWHCRKKNSIRKLRQIFRLRTYTNKCFYSVVVGF
jgi:hypothetical protein